MVPQALAGTADQQLYRRRDSQEVEVLTCIQPGLGCGSIPSDVSLQRLVSTQTRDLAKVKFHNASDRHVRPLWIDFAGHEVRSHTLQPSTLSAWSK